MLGRDVLTGQTRGMRRDEICHSVVKEREMVVKEKSLVSKVVVVKEKWW